MSEEKATNKTGTLKPPMKPGIVVDFVVANDKAMKLCSEHRQDVVVYHDERGGLSQRTVHNSRTMKLAVNVLAVYRFVRGQVLEQIGIIGELI